ncbi:putative abc transporter, permease protein [hydrocarbon metagenome]|uniref:Putative abc transporter, permease protein n=1 Tax=hydrocarbon metagenome TaxID=938273 RepID=A0A0W8E6S4_9ZZZZ
MSQNMESIMPTFEMLPKIVRIMFGVEGLTFQQPLDYYITMYFWYSLLIFTHAAFVGATIIAKEERDKTSEFLFAKPYKRSDIITAKILVGVFHVSIMALGTWLFTIGILLPLFDGASIFSIVSITMLGMFLTQLVFLGLGLLCTALFRKYKAGVSASLLIVLASFVIAVILEYLGSVDHLNFLSPFRYFTVRAVINEGISQLYVLIAAAITAVSIYLTYGFYSRRDLI